MKEQGTGSANCPVIDQFIGQGTQLQGAVVPMISTGTEGCAVITEFFGQGVTLQETWTREEMTAPRDAVKSDGGTAVMESGSSVPQ
jgi:hypothetical protein